MTERQSVRMSKITNDCYPGMAQDALWLYPRGNSDGRQRVKTWREGDSREPLMS